MDVATLLRFVPGLVLLAVAAYGLYAGRRVPEARGERAPAAIAGDLAGGVGHDGMAAQHVGGGGGDAVRKEQAAAPVEAQAGAVGHGRGYRTTLPAVARGRVARSADLPVAGS